jgi:hypothetical protein
MSHFYGTLKGSRGEATRCGTVASGVRTVAASWSGAVEVELEVNPADGQDWATVSLIPWEGMGRHQELYRGPVRGLDQRADGSFVCDNSIPGTAKERAPGCFPLQCEGCAPEDRCRLYQVARLSREKEGA